MSIKENDVFKDNGMNDSDINDNEIRINSSFGKVTVKDSLLKPGKPSGEIEKDEESIKPNPQDKSYKLNKIIIWIIGVIALIILVITAFILITRDSVPEYNEFKKQDLPQSHSKNVTDNPNPDKAAAATPYTIKEDTCVNGIDLMILTPKNATPSLEIGSGVPEDASLILAAQAADVRDDNGGIVGTFVMKGNLISKGESKAGYCSIIDGNITVGMADASPKLEETLMADGYFFRQYPLVASGQLIENKPKGRAVRKALAEMDSNISVIISKERMTFHDFSQALIDLGVRNAIYLVGANSLGVYVDDKGERYSIGKAWDKEMPNVNYIVWR